MAQKTKTNRNKKPTVAPRRQKVARASQRLTRHLPFLHALQRGEAGMRRAIISAASPPLIHSISECSQHLLRGGVPVSPRCKALLARHARDLRAISSPARGGVSVVKRRRILKKSANQSGGFLSLLLGTVLPAIVSGILAARARSK